MTDFDKNETFRLLISKIQSTAKENDLPEKSVKGFTDFIENFFNQEVIDGELAKSIGQYFYYYAQIDEVLSEIIKSLLPELDLELLGIDSSVDKNSFLKKVELIKSLTPNSSNLKIFPLLHKLNTVRNQFAHIDPKKLDFTKINSDLVNVFKEAFTVDNEFSKVISAEATTNKIIVPVKIISITKMYLQLFARIESLGKKENQQLRLFEALRGYSSLYVRRRFSILAYMIQTQRKSSDAPEDFKRASDFDKALEELNSAVKSFLT
jgi:hypothetical protein